MNADPVLEYLHHIHACLDGLVGDAREIRARLNEMDVQVASLSRGQLAAALTLARQQAALNLLAERVQRIEQPLEAEVRDAH
jgi:hypothetical protein